MLAGTVLSNKSLEELQAMLIQLSIPSEIKQDEIVLNSTSATLYFRTGFEHEYILVGDASDGETLLSEANKISALLRQHSIQHGYEIYDTDNQQIFDYEFAD